MNSLQPYTSSANIAPENAVFKPQETAITGTVIVCPYTACWLQAPKGNGESVIKLTGDYPEVLKGYGEVVLCLNVRLRNLSQSDGQFPMYLPINYFFGKKKGDIVEIACGVKGKHFSLTCEPKKSDYKHLDATLEKMVEDVFMKTYNTLSEIDQKGKLSEGQQQYWAIINEMKREHYSNLDVKI